MVFEEALIQIKNGKLMTRRSWNGPGQFVFLVNGSTFQVNRLPLLGIFAAGTTIRYRPHIDIRLADGTISVWQPSMGDVMADDWVNHE